jgi:hypothetical protein
MTIQPHYRPNSGSTRHIPKGSQAPLTNPASKGPDQYEVASAENPGDSGSSPDQAKRRDHLKATALIRAVESGRPKSIEHRVGSILSHYPSTRDCDIDLQLKYWHLWDGWDGQPISPHDLKKKLTRLNSIIRVRARIQNRYGLFQATEKIRKRRRTLSEEERQLALNSPDRFDYISVFTDESGKTGDYLVVGGIWISDPRELLQLEQALADWRSDRRFESELHFSELKPQKVVLYQEALNVILSAAPSISFKALKLPKAGLSDITRALDNLFFHYIVKGVEHEHFTGRCVLPRQVRFWKDSEQPGSDLLRIANIRNRVAQYGQACLDGKLAIGEFECKPSHQFAVLQIADLFVGSVGRILNPGTSCNHKDEFAKYLLERIGMPKGPEEFSETKDVSTLFSL